MQRPSIERLREAFEYDEETGLLRWKINQAFSRIGDVAGAVTEGYVRVSLDGKKMRAHHVIWAMKTGQWSKSIIDHEDCDGVNNRWKNLREATRSQNCANARKKCDNRTGFKGTTKLPSGRFAAQIMKEGRNKYLGSYDTVEEAHAAYMKAAVRLFGEFARGD